MPRLRLVVIGGSGAATPELGDALGTWPGGVERRPTLQLVLVGRTAAKLDVVAAETRRRVAAGPAGPPVDVAVTTDRRGALDGADIVVNAVRIGGLAARRFDESFPRRFGLPGEETMGPGGLANALRTVPALGSTWSDIAELAKDALVINLTNPAGIVVAAAERMTGIRVVSVCDSPVTLADAVASRLGRREGETRQRYIGLNHLGWWVPGSDADLEATIDLATGLDPDAVRAQGAVGGPYVRYYVHPDRLLAAQEAAGGTRADQLVRLESELLDGFAIAADGLPRRGAAWYSKAVVPLVDAWLSGSDEPLIVGSRNDGRVPGLPAAVTTEGPVTFPSPRTMSPLPATRLPPLAAALLAAHAAFEESTIEALATGSPRAALVRAMLANPMVGSFDQAVGLVDAILAASPR